MFSGGPPNQSRTCTTPAGACSASSVDCSTLAAATAATNPAITASATTSISSAAAAAGTPPDRIQRTGGHNTVQTTTASATGRMITQASPTTHARIHRNADTATTWIETVAADRRWAPNTEPRLGSLSVTLPLYPHPRGSN